MKKKGQQNEDPLRQTTINSCDARRPLIAIITKKEPQKTFWLAYRANIRSDAPTTKKAATIDEKVTRYTYRLILLLLRKNCIYLSRIICIFSRLKISSKSSFFSFFVLLVKQESFFPELSRVSFMASCQSHLNAIFFATFTHPPSF